MTALDAAPAPSAAVSPGLRATARRWGFWVVIAVLVLGGAALSLATAGTGVGGQRLGPDNPAPQGAKAVAQVLRGQGVGVTAVETSAAALEALAGAAEATLVIHDPSGYLGGDRLDRLVGAADTVVLLEPGNALLAAFAPGVQSGGTVSGAVDAACSDATAARAGTVIGDDRTYRVLTAPGAEGCFPDTGSTRFRLVVLEGRDGRVVVLGATSALTNESATAAGNGALALGLLGEHPDLVWLVPTVAEVAGDAPPTIADLSPGWVAPFAALAGLVAVAAAVWRGRRLGPLVVEPLPVIVPASETMRGRARLYARTGARLRAADALRLGAIGRLASDCGLPAAASLEDIVGAVAAVSGRPPAAVRGLLVDRVPASDRDLVAVSDELAALERDVHSRTRPGG